MAARRLGFPLILGAHDHDPFVEVIEGCQLIKVSACLTAGSLGYAPHPALLYVTLMRCLWAGQVGMDAKQVGIIDLTWDTVEQAGWMPTVSVRLVDACNYQPDPEVARTVAKHMKVGVRTRHLVKGISRGERRCTLVGGVVCMAG
jgi:hypothetical protein